jgi:murein DD-endopeptidase MepM/ murein hydrolase activator NlpD
VRASLVVALMSLAWAGCELAPMDEPFAAGGGAGGGRVASGGGTGGGGSVVVDAGAPGADGGFLHRPFQGEFRISNFFDHDVPREFIDGNGRQTTWWGESSTFLDGHDGYDFVMPEGTEIFSASDGMVHFAGDEQPFNCPLLGRLASATMVEVDSTGPDGIARRLGYVHLSRVDVTVGQHVTVGQRLGLSGNTGCSTGAHLHFEVDLPAATAAQAIAVDPYGWTGPVADPWISAGGAMSTYLWAPGEAPALFREALIDLTGNTGSWLVLDHARWMGVHDELNPNNEFVEITRDPAYAPASVSLSGYSLKNLAGTVVPLPSVELTATNPRIRVYTGVGTSTVSTLYLNRTEPLWSNFGDCARLVFPNGNAWSLFFGRTDCP